MSRIEGLSVQGIRSFGPMHSQAITLNTPLTLIVGYNGSGKTTIIECLNFATTGQLPPNSGKGGAFIYDPKLRNEKEVPAQVRLKFIAKGGGLHVVSRRMQLKIQKNTRQQKTLECSLRYTNSAGELKVRTTTVSDINADVPSLLGVSPAVLDAVIFCHQDESLWPMSEPSALKKKFDEIFEADKYTKAIELLKVTRKKKGEELQQLKIHEARDRDDMEKGRKTKQTCDQLEREVDELGAQMKAIETEMAEVQRSAREKREQANGYLGIMNKLDNVRDQYNMKQNTVIELRDSLEEMSESDEWLEDNFSQYEVRFQRLSEQVGEHVSQYNQLQKELHDSRRNMNAKLGEKGKHESDKDKYERQLQARFDMVRQAAGLHEIRGFDGELDDNQVLAFSDKLQNVFNSKKKELECTQEANNDKADEANNAISELENRKNTLTSNRVFARQRVQENGKKIKRLQTESDSLQFDEGRVAVLEADKKTLDTRYQKDQDDLVENGLDVKIVDAQREVGTLEKEGEALTMELMECTRLASERAELNLRKEELKAREQKLSLLTDTWMDKFTKEIGVDWKAETVDADFRGVLDERSRTAGKAQEKVNIKQDLLKQVEYKLSAARDRHKTLTAEFRKSETSVVEALKPVAKEPDLVKVGDYLDELEGLEEQQQDLEKDLSLFDELRKYYTKAKKCLDTYDKCSLCDRDFDGPDGERPRAKLTKKIAAQLSERQKELIQADLSGLVKNVRRLKNIRPQFDAYERIQKEIPNVQKEISSAERERSTILQELEGLDKDLQKVKGKQEEIESLKKHVVEVSQLFADVKDSTGQVERLTKQQQLTGEVRSPSEVNEKQQTCAEATRVAKRKLENLVAERQRKRDALSRLELQRSELNNKLDQARQQLERKAKLSEDIEILKDEIKGQDESIHKADQDLTKLQPAIDKARLRRDDMLKAGRKVEKKISEQRDTIFRTVRELKTMDDDIKDYLDRGGPSNLASCQRSIQTLEQTIVKLEADMKQLTVIINEKKEEQANSDRRKRNINDNIKYRRFCKELDLLSRDMEDLKSHKAEEDYDRLMKESQEFEAQRQDLVTKKAETAGMAKSKDAELTRLHDEYKLDYEDAEEKHKKARIRLKTTEAAIADLGVYGGALDKAIMQYHSLKMEEVNRIAGELWSKTYQGTDIDTIAIRSENETRSKTRSYNYRLTMVKQDTEMDMRGRCSAGQKVLASIIIRLALAESFGINCGLIALDEPTTNLDSHNIKALAQSLHSIIKDRMSQANFQLIVITHDEEFLRYMRCSDFCDTFYRVKRDENQCSVIAKENISRIME